MGKTQVFAKIASFKGKTVAVKKMETSRRFNPTRAELKEIKKVSGKSAFSIRIVPNWRKSKKSAEKSFLKAAFIFPNFPGVITRTLRRVTLRYFPTYSRVLIFSDLIPDPRCWFAKFARYSCATWFMRTLTGSFNQIQFFPLLTKNVISL